MIENGVNTSNAEVRLRQKLNEPGTADLLLQILDRLDVIALTVNSVDGFLRRSDTIIENVASSVRDVRDNAPLRNIDSEKAISALSTSMPELIEALPRLTQALPQLLELSERLKDPATAAALNTLLDKMDVIALTITALDGFLRRSDTIIENVAKSVHDVRTGTQAAGFDLNASLQALPQLGQTLPQVAEALPLLTERLPQLMNVADQVQTVLASAEFNALMGSGIFSPETVAVVSHAGDALVESYNTNKANPHQVGLMGLLRALGDPDVQRGLGFLVDFGKRFGQQINK